MRRLKIFLLFIFIIYGAIFIAYAKNHNTPRAEKKEELVALAENQLIDISVPSVPLVPPVQIVPLLVKSIEPALESPKSFDLPPFSSDFDKKHIPMPAAQNLKKEAEGPKIFDKSKKTAPNKSYKFDRSFPPLIGAIMKPERKQETKQENFAGKNKDPLPSQLASIDLHFPPITGGMLENEILEEPKSKIKRIAFLDKNLFSKLKKNSEYKKLNKQLKSTQNFSAPLPVNHTKNSIGFDNTISPQRSINVHDAGIVQKENTDRKNLDAIPRIAPLKKGKGIETVALQYKKPEAIEEQLNEKRAETGYIAETISSAILESFKSSRAQAFMGDAEKTPPPAANEESAFPKALSENQLYIDKTLTNSDDSSNIEQNTFLETRMPLPKQLEFLSADNGKIENLMINSNGQDPFISLNALPKPSSQLILKNKDSIAPSSTLSSNSTEQDTSQDSKKSKMNDNESSFFRLSNGMQVLVKKDKRFPLVSIRLYVHAGSSYERPSQAGISHVLEHMVFKGSRKFPKGQIASEIESSGGYLNAATSFDYTVYLTDMTSDNWEKGLEVLKEMAFYPSLDANELEAEKSVVISELERGKDSPGSNLFDMMIAHSMKDSSYERPIIGYPFTIRAFTPASIREYIDEWYQPQSMLLVINGNIDLEKASKLAIDTFSELKNTHTLVEPMREASLIPLKATAEVQKGPWKKVHLAISFPAPYMADLRSNQLDLLSQLMGGDTTSYLYRKYKYEKRLVDSISMGNFGFEKAGMAFISATLDPDKIAPFWEELTKDLADFKNKSFSDEELERAKLNISDRMFRSKETLGGLTSKLGYFYFFFTGEEAETNYLRSIEDISHEEIANAAKDFLSPEKASVLLMIPEDSSLDGLGFAKSKEQDIASILLAELNKNWKTEDKKAEDKKETSLGEVESIDLGKGRTLILIPDNTLPYVSASLLFKGGNSALSLDDQGLGAFTASLLTKGAGKLSANDIQDYLSNRAASLGASSGVQSFSLSFDSPSKFLPDIFKILNSIIMEPSFAIEESDRVKEDQIAAIVRSEDSALSLAFRRMFSAIFPGHSYGYLQLGEVEGVKNFNAEEARKFWEEQRKKEWVFTICGNFNKDEIIQAAKELPVPEISSKKLLKPKWNQDKDISFKLEGRKQSHLMLLFPTAPVGSKDEAGLELLNNILAGQSGLLFRELRDKQGLGYSVTSFPWKSKEAGALILYIGTEADKIQTAKNGFTRIIGELHKKTLPDSELQRGKSQMQGDYYRGRQARSARSQEAASLSILGLPLDSGQEIIDKALKLSPTDIQELTRKYLQLDKAYIIKVEP